MLFMLVLCSPASAATLDAGAGRSDVTPPTGFATMGYVRSDAVARGQHTRLFARAIVLRQGGRKLALVTTDLGFTPGGLVVEVAKLLEKRGFSEQNIIVSASHTHSAPAGYANFESDNFVAPTMGTPTEFKVAGDPQLYGYLIKRVALSITRADRDLGPARAAWGRATLAGVTDNRSLEAHLANFGFDLPYGTGSVDQNPRGYIGTIDPQVDVLRVDRVGRGGRAVPLGAWLDFADDNIFYAAERIKELQGKITRIVYIVPAGRSPLEVLSNYEEEVANKGGQTLYKCREQECGGDNRFGVKATGWHQNVLMKVYPVSEVRQPSASTGDCALREDTGGTRYTAMALPTADGQTAHVAVVTYQLKTHSACMVLNERTVVVVVIVEPKAREQRMTTVGAPEMNAALSRDGRIVLHNILFDFDKADIKPESRPQVEEIAKLLQASPNLRMHVVGHTDNQGQLAYNMDLSRRRAQSVVQALVQGNGIAATRLIAHGAGPIAPRAPGGPLYCASSTPGTWSGSAVRRHCRRRSRRPTRSTRRGP